MIKHFIYIILFTSFFINCSGNKTFITNNSNISPKRLNKNEYQIIICYRDSDLVFDKSIAVDNTIGSAFDNTFFDYVVYVNNIRIKYYIDYLIDILENIELAEKYDDYKLEIFARFDLISEKGIVFQYCLGEFYKDVVWFNGAFYKTKDYQILNSIVELFKPWQCYRSNKDLKIMLQNMRKEMIKNTAK
jgi:hypothetical protein